MPSLDTAVVLNLLPGEYALWRVQIGTAERLAFQNCRDLFDWKPSKMQRLRPPGPDGQPAPIHIEDVEELAKCRNKLNAAGFTTLVDLNKLSRSDMLALNGIGEKTADLIIEVLTANGLYSAAVSE